MIVGIIQDDATFKVTEGEENTLRVRIYDLIDRTNASIILDRDEAVTTALAILRHYGASQVLVRAWEAGQLQDVGGPAAQPLGDGEAW